MTAPGLVHGRESVHSSGFYVCSTVQANTAIYKNPGTDRIGTATKGDLFYSVQTVNGYDGGYDETDNNTFGWINQKDIGQPLVVCHPA